MATQQMEQLERTRRKPRARTKTRSPPQVQARSSSKTREKKCTPSARAGAKKGLSQFVRGLDKNKLLKHTEEILLAKQVQRLHEVENVYAQLQGRHGTCCSLCAAKPMFPDKTAEFREPRDACDAAAAQSAFPGGDDAINASPTEALHAPLLDVAARGSQSAQVALPSLSEGFISEAALEEWANATNISSSELRSVVSDGRRAMATIVETNVRLVGAAIQQLKRSSGGKIDKGTTEADLMQEGCIALVNAAAKFDVSMGCRFSTYATFWVRNAVRKAMKEQSRTIRLPLRVHHAYGRIQRASAELAARTTKPPSDEQVAAMLDERSLDAQKVRLIIDQMHWRTKSLDAKLGGKQEDFTLGDSIEDDGVSSQEQVVLSMLRSDLRRLMQKYLDPDENRVLMLRFGLTDGVSRTLRQIGEELGVEPWTAKRILFSALNKLRKPHVAVSLRAYLDGDDEDLHR